MNSRCVKKLTGIIVFMIFYLSNQTFAYDNQYHAEFANGILTMKECMNCHSKSKVKSVTICVSNNCLYSMDHSLMHVYPPKGQADKYASLSEITQAGCILENGKVTCLSCHDLTKPPPHLIQEGDKLCLICHKYLKSNSP